MINQMQTPKKIAHTHSHAAFRGIPANTENFDTIRDKKMYASARSYRRSHTGIGEIENPENLIISKNCESLEKDKDPGKTLTQLRGKNLSRPIIGHININFLESQFEALK